MPNNRHTILNSIAREMGQKPRFSRRNGKVWVNGCFDVIHAGHIKMLEFAWQNGKEVIVGLDSDQRVEQLKGPNRPINNISNRIYLMESIKYVDEVVTFDNEDSLRNAIQYFNIDKIVVGEEYKNKEVIGGELVQEILFFPRFQNLSTTNILKT